MHVFEEPYTIAKLLDHSAYKLRDECGKLRGEFNQKQTRCIRKLMMKHKYINEEVVTADARTNHRSKEREREREGEKNRRERKI
jgi:hypothetical protein